MLNTGEGGSVYFGISSHRVIEGVKITRLDKDIFRKGIMTLKFVNL